MMWGYEHNYGMGWGILGTVISAVVGILAIAAVVIVLVRLSRREHIFTRPGVETAATNAAPTNATTPTPTTTIDARLRDADDLHTRGVISDAEHAATRERILRDI